MKGKVWVVILAMIVLMFIVGYTSEEVGNFFISVIEAIINWLLTLLSNLAGRFSSSLENAGNANAGDVTTAVTTAVTAATRFIG